MALVVSGPKVLGHATNIVFDGVISGQGVDFDALHRTLLIAVGLYVGSYVLSYAAGVGAGRRRPARRCAACAPTWRPSSTGCR